MISVTSHVFNGGDEAMVRIRESGLHLAEAELSQEGLTASTHRHPHGVQIYMLAGELEQREPQRGLKHALKALIPVDGGMRA